MTKINSNITTTIFCILYVNNLYSYALSLYNFVINSLSKFLYTEEDLDHRSKRIHFNIHFEKNDIKYTLITSVGSNSHFIYYFLDFSLEPI